MSHPFEDDSRNAADIMEEMRLLKAVDPRPIKCEDLARRALKRIKGAGYLVSDLKQHEESHLHEILMFTIWKAVLEDRKDRIMP